MKQQELSSTAYHFDENLRDVPNDVNALLKHIENLQQEYKHLQNPADQIRVMGELGVYLRQLMKLDEAERILEQAIQLVSQHQLGIKLETQQKIRLAHVYQWKMEFIKSTQHFSDITYLCRNNVELKGYLVFALQHAGKNYFDQKKYNEALLNFNEALEIRTKNNSPSEQIESTKFAIKTTKERLYCDKINISKSVLS